MILCRLCAFCKQFTQWLQTETPNLVELQTLLLYSSSSAVNVPIYVSSLFSFSVTVNIQVSKFTGVSQIVLAPVVCCY